MALPEHSASGGFDHVAVHAASGHVCVANTVNDAVDVFDPTSQRHLYSVPQLRGVAGVLVSDEAQLIISSNHRAHERLYVAVGDPGTIDIFDTKTMRNLGIVVTEKGARTFALAPVGDQV